MARKLLLSLLSAVLVLSIPVFADEVTPAGRMAVSAASVEWQASAGNVDKVVLTVQTPSGANITREFDGTRATFRPQDMAPRLVEEGLYHYTMTLVPKISDAVRQQLAAARANDDTAAIAKIKADAHIGEPVVMSGVFTIHNGSFVTDMPEPPAGGGTLHPKEESVHLNPTANDIVQTQNEEIQGSLCVGLDCVSGESFGFDTIKVKENNTRIHFDDTSTSTGFPNNDWQLTANDSNSGGANKFSIDDLTNSKTPFTITAAAPTNSLFVASSGKVGFGNNSPVLNLHITATDTPAIRQEQTSGGGFTAQTWDIGANEANWFVRDVTGGSRLPLRIRPGAPTSSIDIAASGSVGFGTASPSYRIHMLDTADENGIITSENTNSTGVSAAGVLRAKADTAFISVTGHGTARTISRFGVTLGGWDEILANAGNGLAIGTASTVPLILGTNSTNRMQIDGTTGAVTVSGNFTVTGVKNFAVPDPTDASKAIYYASLEGPEAGTYFRGTAKTVNGEAVIQLPDYFSKITEKERMTVQLTPIGAPGQPYVAEKTPDHLTIKVAKGADDVQFDYLVQGIRKGYLDFAVERANDLPKN